MTLSNFSETYTAGQKGADTTNKEKNGVVGVLVGSNDNSVSVSAKAENYSASLTLERNNVPASAYTLLINSATATFSGSTATIAMTSKDGQNQESENVDHSGSALLVHGYKENSDPAIDTGKMTKVMFSAGETKLSTTMEGAVAGSTNVLHVEGNARVDFTGKSVDISTVTASNAVDGEDGDFTAGIGICLEADNARDSEKTAGTANLHTGADTTLNITVEGTGTTLKTKDGSFYPTGGAAFLSGIYAEGGELYAEGDVKVNVTAKAGMATGLVLTAKSLDHSSLSEFDETSKEWKFSTLGESVSYDHTSTFAKQLDVTVHSDTGRTVGVLLATPCCDLDGMIEEKSANGKTEITESDTVTGNDNRVVNAVTKLTVNDLTVNVTKGETNTFASDGILLVNTKVNGTPELVVNGTATITADNALRSEYWVNDGVVGEGDVNAKVTVGKNASLTLDGNVSGYAGDFVQNGGTVTVKAKDGKFFGGAVQVLGGKLTAENADWTVANNSVLKGDVTLGNVTVNSGNDLQMTGGKLAAKSFSLLGGKIEGDADLTLFGGDEDESIIRNSATLKVKNLTLDGKNGNGIDDGAFIDVHTDSKLIVTGDMTLTNKTVLSGSAKTVHAKKLFLENGSWYYDQNLSDTREFQVSDGVLVLRGGQLITSVDGKETDSADKAARIESLLLKKSSDAVFSAPVAAYIEAGTYDFQKGVTIADDSSEMRIKGDNTVVNIGALAVNGGSFVIGDGAKASDKPLVTVKTISIADGAKMELISGTLNTTTDQIFKNSLGADGKTIDVGSQIYADNKLALSGGTLAFSDAFYNSLYAQSAAKTLNENSTTTLVFNGERVDAPQGTVGIDQIGDSTDVVESNVTVEVKGTDGTANIDKSFGVSKIEVAKDVTAVSIKGQESAQKTIKLVGSSDAKGELISGTELKTVAVDAYATLQLGQSGSTNNQGQISKPLTVAANGTLAVNEGTFKLADVTATKGSVEIAAGTVTFEQLTANEGAIKISDGASVKVDTSLTLQGNSQITAGANLVVKELKLDTAATHEITGAMTIDKLTVTGDKAVVLNIGTNDDKGNVEANKKGSLKIGSGNSLKGLTFFLDPAWKDGSTVADASSLIVDSDKVDGEIVVGQNSYVVLGSDSADAFLDVVRSGAITWGETNTTAAAYVAKPITIGDSGKLVVNGSFTSYDAYTSTLSTLSTRATPASVVFAAGSTLVANVGTLSAGEALITAKSFDVNASAQAVLTNVTSGSTYTLLKTTDGTVVNFEKLKAANSLFSLDVNKDGTIKARMNDAAQIFGSAMQGTAIANAATAAGNSYVNGLLSDITSTVALSDIAAKFDAAMNPAGALTTFTTAYDRASELRQIVRDETAAADGDNRLWVHVTGGKTKLKGISTGGQDLHTKTTAYGIVVGGEAAIADGKLGFALTAGTGDTKNNSVSAKDEFNYRAIA